ncbi:MAG: flagellar hook-basal body complex protein FliE, partial [Proteobacteria bacterium]|nr:flagellar hook-basal body complex protein FliE [Pseudomonadota bacterium]
MVDKILTAALTPPGNLMRANPAIPSKPSMPTGGQSFAELLSEVGQNSVANSNQSEKMGLQSITKSAELVDIVTAVSNAEVTLETVMALRDRLIQAYQEVI